ncbi:Peroxiredoxin DOT5 [Spathaspora sp. JA1]|nr:Peroxiredoxin DOT5 [Spathaspora sp. JA1]
MPELRRSARVASRPSSAVSVPTEEPAKKKSKPAKATVVEDSGSSTVSIGDKIPDLTLQNQDGIDISLRDAAKKTKYLVIFAYPRASTPGCTRQACGFQRNYQFFNNNNVTVFGLSADSPKAQKNFQDKQHLQYDLLCDTNKQLIGALGAKKSPSGVKRSHWIFVDGILKIARVQISPESSIEGAKQEIEEFISKDSSNGKDEPKLEEPKVEEPSAVEEPKVEEQASVEEPKSELAEEPKVEEPKVEEEAKIEEPKISEPAPV